MKLSTPVIPCALILSFAMVVASGCGAKGGKTDPAATAFLARFLAGDPSVKADGHEITFSEGGAPSDGSVERVDLTALVDKLLSQDIQLPAVSGVQVNYDDSVVEPALRIEYVSPTSIQDKSIPGGNFHLVMALALPLYEDPEGRMFLGRNADLRADREAYKARFTSGPTTRFGLLETGFSAELTGIQTGDAVAYSLGLRQAPLTSGVEWKAEAWVNDAKVADLGTFPPDTEHATSSTFSVPLWQHGLPVELRLQPDDDTQWPAFTVRCHSDIGLDALYEPRVYDTPFAPEAVSSIEAELFQVLHDSASPLAPGDFPIEMAGQGLFIGVCLGSGSLEEVDSTDPSPGSAAYSSSFTSRWRGSFNKPTTGGGEHSLTSADLIGAARVLVGAWGVSIANYDTGLGAFETHAIDEIGNMTDVHPFDGDTSATDLVYVDHSGDAIKFIESDAQEQYVLAPGKTISNVAWAGASGRVVSAFRHPSGDLLFVTDGEPGELCVKGKQVMRGYWGKDNVADGVFTEDGYFRTGDIATIDAEGYIRIVDRKKDMILVSGFNVFPNEIEDVLAGMPGLVETACIGIPDEKSGEAVKVVCVRKDDTVTAEAVIAFCRHNLTAYKVPHHVEFVAELPKSTVGKILRRELRPA